MTLNAPPDREPVAHEELAGPHGYSVEIPTNETLTHERLIRLANYHGLTFIENIPDDDEVDGITVECGPDPKASEFWRDRAVIWSLPDYPHLEETDA